MILAFAPSFQGTLLSNHAIDGATKGNSHEYILIKIITDLSAKIICYHQAKQRTIKATAPKNLGVRQKLIKLILFNNA